jgi:hypothetical protein
LEVDPAKRLTAADVLASVWIQSSQQAAPSPCSPVDSEVLATSDPAEGVQGLTEAIEVAELPEVTESAEMANVEESAEVAEMTEATESVGVRLPDLEETVAAPCMAQGADVSGRRGADRADKVRLYALCQAA